MIDENILQDIIQFIINNDSNINNEYDIKEIMTDIITQRVQEITNGFMDGTGLNMENEIVNGIKKNSVLSAEDIKQLNTRINKELKRNVVLNFNGFEKEEIAKVEQSLLLTITLAEESLNLTSCRESSVFSSSGNKLINSVNFSEISCIINNKRTSDKVKPTVNKGFFRKSCESFFSCCNKSIDDGFHPQSGNDTQNNSMNVQSSSVNMQERPLTIINSFFPIQAESSNCVIGKK